eukprot:gene4894-8701_t
MADKTIVSASGVCFLTSLLLGCVASGTSSWIVRDFHGLSRYGLFQTCEESIFQSNSRTSCESQLLSTAWAVTAALILLGLFILLVAVLNIMFAFVRRDYLDRAKWQAFFAGIISQLSCDDLSSLTFFTAIALSCASVIFEPYRLPEDTNVGFSYILFIICLALLFIGELFAARIIITAN